MNKRVAITGMGIISSIGNSVEQNFQSLINGKTGISTIENLETIHKEVIKVGEIKLSNQQLAQQLNLSEDNNFSRTTLLGAIAVREALENANIKNINDCRSGFISATSVGGMDLNEKYFYEYYKDESLHKYINSHDAGDSSHQIADYIGLKGMVTTVSTACSSAANAIMLGCRLIQSGQLDRVIVGGTDALAKFTINGFKTLMILSDTYNTPFDNDRKGLNLGEAAAFLVLESDEVVQKSNKKVLAYVSGFGNANDAFHQTASSENGEGAFLAMQKAFKLANLQPNDIDYINAHATSTGVGDLSEIKAISAIFGNSNTAISATKSMTGHLLGAAGAIESIYCVLAVQHDTIPPTMNVTDLDPEIPQNLQIVLGEKLEKPIRYALNNSVGFGGHTASSIFKKFEA